MGILSKKYSDLTVGEILGWSFGVGLTTLAIEAVALKGPDTVKEELKDCARGLKDSATEMTATLSENMKELKTRFKK